MIRGLFNIPRTAAVTTALAGLVALTLVASVVTLFVSADYYVDLSHDREEVQAQNALDLKLQRLRNDLTSVTFWDEAVENTALRFDEAWVDENVGQWLHRFYAADRVFVLGAGNQPLYANAEGVKLPANTYAAVAAQAAPMVAKVRAGAAAYRPGANSVTVGRDLSRGYDEAAFAVVDGRPVFLIVAPILHDFGSVGAPANGGYALLVSAYDVDQDFLATLSKSVMLDRMSMSGWPARAAPGDGELVLRNASDQRIAVLHWRTQRHMGDVVQRLLPFALIVLLVMSGAAILVYRFIRSSTRDLTVTRHEARHDELTGLANRRLLMEALGEAVAAKQGGAALLFVDLDRFKDVNDMWGHEAGDKVLRTVGRRIRRLFPNDTVARFGGDEFVVLVADGDADGARSQAASLLAALNEPHTVEGTTVSLSGSVGVAVAQGTDASPDELIRRADIALYQAKTKGRSRIAFFETAMDDDLHHRRRIEGELRRAIESNAVTVLYQPKVCAKTHAIVGVEALARVSDADGRMVSPSVFVPIAEESGLIAGLGERVLRTACADAARWTIGVAVNLSPAQFRSDDIVDLVRSALDASGLEPSRLTLEITETVLVKDPDGARRRLDALRAMGVKLALDDFGTGYSSLVYLQRFKLDSMKIAQGFLEGLAPDTDAMTVLSSMVTLGHALGLTVVAEGVETVRQVELLKRAGADEFQGNVFAEPMSRAGLEATLGSSDGAVIPLRQGVGRQAATRAV